MTRRFPRFLRILILPIAALGIGAVAYAGSTGFSHADHHQMMLNHMSSELNLSDAQVAELEEIMEDTREAGEAIHAEHETLRKQGLELLRAEEIDAKAVEAQRRQMLKLADRGSATMADALLDASEVLTYEQRLQLADKLESFHENGGPRGHFEQMRQRMHH